MLHTCIARFDMMATVAFFENLGWELNTRSLPTKDSVIPRALCRRIPRSTPPFFFTKHAAFPVASCHKHSPQRDQHQLHGNCLSWQAEGSSKETQHRSMPMPIFKSAVPSSPSSILLNIWLVATAHGNGTAEAQENA